MNIDLKKRSFYLQEIHHRASFYIKAENVTKYDLHSHEIQTWVNEEYLGVLIST